MLNKPKYTLLKNTSYALAGLIEIFKNEKSFRLQVLLLAILTIVVWILPVSLIAKSILQISVFLPVLSEIINSAIERVVDLVTTEYNELAKNAKDAGASLVFVSFIIEFIIWSLTLYISFFN